MFEKQLAIGRAGEKQISEWLQSRGWFVIPSYDFSGQDGDKAPKLRSGPVSFAVPDLDVAKEGTRLWVEVKTKSGPTLHRNSGTWEHGINLRLYLGYKKVEHITGCECWVIVYEQSGGDVLVASFRQLGEPRVYSGSVMGPSGMAFWPREKFTLAGNLSAK